MALPQVSIIIPSFNSAKYIKKCLESIKKQTYKNIEIIVIDKGSTDQTRKIAKTFTKNVFTFGHERASQLNFGFKKAKGDYLYRVDSDFILEPKVVEECVKTSRLKGYDGIAIHNTSAEGLGFWSDVRKLERNTYRDDDLIVAVRFFTKKAYDKIGGFDESLYGPEDYDFHNRFVKNGYRWGRINATEKHLGEPRSLAEIWKKHFFYGRQMLKYFKKYPKIAAYQFNPIRKSYFRHIDQVVKNPKIFLGIIIMTIVKFTAGGLGFLYALVSKNNQTHKQ